MDATLTLKYVSTLAACSCPDWFYRRRTPAEPCKHVKRLQDARAPLEAQGVHNRTKGIPRPVTDVAYQEYPDHADSLIPAYFPNLPYCLSEYPNHAIPRIRC